MGYYSVSSDLRMLKYYQIIDIVMICWLITISVVDWLHYDGWLFVIWNFHHSKPEGTIVAILACCEHFFVYLSIYLRILCLIRSFQWRNMDAEKYLNEQTEPSEETEEEYED